MTPNGIEIRGFLRGFEDTIKASERKPPVVPGARFWCLFEGYSVQIEMRISRVSNVMRVQRL